MCKHVTRKNVVVTLRLTKEDKKYLEKLAEVSGKNTSDYVRKLIHAGKKGGLVKERELAECVTLCQNIINHVREKYQAEDDKVLAEMEDELWNLLQ